MKKIVLSTLVVALLYGCNGLPNGTIAKENSEIKRSGSSDINELVEQFATLEVEKGERLKFDLDQHPLSITIIKWNVDGSNELVEMEDASTYNVSERRLLSF